MLEPFLITLSQELELQAPLQKDKSAQFTLALNETAMIVLQELDEGILLRARIGPLPEKKQEEACMHLMKGNFLGQGTGSSIIGLEENEKFLTLSQILPYDINYKLFKLQLEEFANYLSYWQEDLIQLTVKD